VAEKLIFPKKKAADRAEELRELYEEIQTSKERMDRMLTRFIQKVQDYNELIDDTIGWTNELLDKTTDVPFDQLSSSENSWVGELCLLITGLKQGKLSTSGLDLDIYIDDECISAKELEEMSELP
jgi:hypothetical protein